MLPLTLLTKSEGLLAILFTFSLHWYYHNHQGSLAAIPDYVKKSKARRCDATKYGILLNLVQDPGIDPPLALHPKSTHFPCQKDRSTITNNQGIPYRRLRARLHDNIAHYLRPAAAGKVTEKMYNISTSKPNRGPGYGREIRFPG